MTEPANPEEHFAMVINTMDDMMARFQIVKKKAEDGLEKFEHIKGTRKFHADLSHKLNHPGPKNEEFPQIQKIAA